MTTTGAPAAPQVDRIASPALAALLERHDAFWKRSVVERPLVGEPQRESVFPLRNIAAVVSDGLIRSENIRPEDWLPRDRGGPLEDGGDLLRAHWAAPALPWTEAIAGCPVYVVQDSGTTWAAHALPPSETLATFHPRLDKAWLAKLVDCTRALAVASAGYWVSTTLMRGPLDMLSAMIGAQRLCEAMIDEPAQIRRLLDFCCEVWIEAAHAQLAVMPIYHDGVPNRYRIWAPGPSVVFQADLSSTLSPRMYREFLLPCDRCICDAFPYVTLHSHSAGQTQLATMLELDGLACIEISVDHIGPGFADQLPLYRRILQRKSLVLMNPNSEEVDMALRELPAAGLAMIPRWESNLEQVTS